MLKSQTSDKDDFCSTSVLCPGITWYHSFRIISPGRDAYATADSANHVTKLKLKLESLPTSCQSGRSSRHDPADTGGLFQKEQEGSGPCSTMRQFVRQESSLPEDRTMADMVVLQQESGQLRHI